MLNRLFPKNNKNLFCICPLMVIPFMCKIEDGVNEFINGVMSSFCGLEKFARAD